LNSEGILAPRGKRWGKTTLHKILINEAYTGTLVWGRTSKNSQKAPPIRVEDAWEPIVDRDTFIRVQSLLRERAPVHLHPRRANSHYLLSGLARCGHCGKALVGQKAKSGQFNYYVCNTLLKQGAGTCPAPYLNSRMFEKVVIDKVKERILTQENLCELVRLVNEEMDAAASETRQRLETVTKAFIRSFVKEVRETGKEVVLTYTIPLPPQGPLQETAAVLDTVHYGGPLCIKGKTPTASLLVVGLSGSMGMV
jgi:hypothetical protein